MYDFVLKWTLMSDVHQVERVIEAIQLFRVNFGAWFESQSYE